MLPSVSQIGICINDINFAISPTNIVYRGYCNKQKNINKNTNINETFKPKIFKSLELNNISFKYKNSDKKVLDKLSIKIIKK